MSLPDPRCVYCTTLGCDKNLVDSEALLGRFYAKGFELTLDPEQAGIWVLNTCGFISAARNDSTDTLERFAEAKGPDRLLVVTGCWAQEHGAEILEKYPSVDLVGGVGQFDELVDGCLQAERLNLAVEPERANYPGMGSRVLLTPGHVAFVKIGEGCNCSCTFCRIPLIRGKLTSRPAAAIEDEVRGLVTEGVTEIQLVSQNTSDWGRDRDDNLLALVKRLDGIDGLRRIRLLYMYAGLTSADQALRLLDCEKVAPYLDLPVQHAAPRLLKAMKRPGNPDAVEKFFARVRAARPEVVLRTTILLGFPGETEEDIEQLTDFLVRVQFDHLGTYSYSPEDGTAAALLPDRVSDEQAADREARILDLQADISLERQRSRLGQQFDVVVDAVGTPEETGTTEVVSALSGGISVEKSERSGLNGVLVDGGRVAVGRSFHFGYDLDGVVIMPAGELIPGDWVPATFTAATPFDIWAQPGSQG